MPWTFWSQSVKLELVSNNHILKIRVVKQFKKDTTANFKYIIHANGHRLWFNFCVWCDVFRITVKQIRKHCQYLDAGKSCFSIKTTYFASVSSGLNWPINDESLLLDQIPLSNHNGPCLCNDTSLRVDYCPGTWGDRISAWFLQFDHSANRVQRL